MSAAETQPELLGRSEKPLAQAIWEPAIRRMPAGSWLGFVVLSWALLIDFGGLCLLILILIEVN